MTATDRTDESARDEQFLTAFERSWREHLDELGVSLSIVIRSGDDLHHHYANRHSRATIVGERYHTLKRFAHLPVLAYLQRLRADDHADCPVVDDNAFDVLSDDETLAAHAQELSRLTERFWLATEDVVAWDVLDAFVRDVFSPAKALVGAAATLEVERLHAELQRMESNTPESAWRAGYFCVVGGKEPRYKELTTQYFRAYLDRRGCARGGNDHQLIYAEGNHTIDSVFELTAKRHLTRTLGELFTGSPTGLEQDVLGNAASLAVARCFAGDSGQSHPAAT